MEGVHLSIRSDQVRAMCSYTMQTGSPSLRSVRHSQGDGLENRHLFRRRDCVERDVHWRTSIVELQAPKTRMHRVEDVLRSAVHRV